MKTSLKKTVKNRPVKQQQKTIRQAAEDVRRLTLAAMRARLNWQGIVFKLQKAQEVLQAAKLRSKPKVKKTEAISTVPSTPATEPVMEAENTDGAPRELPQHIRELFEHLGIEFVPAPGITPPADPTPAQQPDGSQIVSIGTPVETTRTCCGGGCQTDAVPPATPTAPDTQPKLLDWPFTGKPYETNGHA